MTSGLKRILTRLSVATAAVAFAMVGAFALSSPAQATDSTSYTMECGLTWYAAEDDGDWAYTDKAISNMGTCTSKYAWVNPYLSSGWYGKTSGYDYVIVSHSTISKSWHSGCQSGCHTETLY